MRSHESWFLALMAMVVVGPYILGVRPKTTREWRLIAVTVALLSLMLLMMARLRAG